MNTLKNNLYNCFFLIKFNIYKKKINNIKYYYYIKN
jgi:hypothetical protein